MQHSTDRILTTHVGSLPRPHKLLDILKAKLNGKDVNENELASTLSASVNEIVKEQAGAGIDIITDGEMSKPGHAFYINERLQGFESRPDLEIQRYIREQEDFPEYYEEYFARAMLGGAIAPSAPIFCVGPIQYIGQEALRTDLENLKAAMASVEHVEAFMPCAAVTGVGFNEFYATEEEYLFAVADALSEEYRAIVEAGFLLQVDDPFMPDVFMDESLNDKEKDTRVSMLVEAINHSIKGIPEEKIRFHTCYGINAGPRIHEPSLPDMIEYVLQVNAGAYSFEAANARHEHEYHLWEKVKLPDGKMIMPGVITHASTVVEHPEYIAERIIRFAERVGRENVLASADCGFSSQAMYKTEIDRKVVWAKFRALREGADLASKILWAK